jgi:hypothetical protein
MEARMPGPLSGASWMFLERQQSPRRLLPSSFTVAGCFYFAAIDMVDRGLEISVSKSGPSFLLLDGKGISGNVP